MLVVRELGKKVIAQNKSARHDYFIEEVYECGLVLTGTEVKSLRAGRASLTDGYAMAKDGEIWVSGLHIPEYNQGSWTNHMPMRDRKLLLHKRQIAQISGVIKQGGLTLIPLSLYFKDGKVKVEIAVAKGKKAHDKRETLKQRQANREVDRELSRHASGKSNSKRKKSDEDYD